MSLTKVSTSMIADTAISVQSYGAKGDGVTDDSAAINAAIADLGYGYLSMPEVSYYVESPIIVGRNQVLFGDGNGFQADESIANPTILSKRGAPAVWVQGSYSEVHDLSIKVDKADLTDFTDDQDICILIRDIDSFSPTPPASWAWVNGVTVQNVGLARGFMGVQMEAVYRITLSQINTWTCKFGVAYNYDQRQIFGAIGAIPKYATTLLFSDIYCRGGYPNKIPGGYGFWGDQTFGLNLTDIIAEGFDTCAFFFNTHGGSMTNLYAERNNAGVQLIGNLSPFVVQSPYVFYGVGDSQYAFRGQFGTTVFIGGEAVLPGGPSVYFSPVDSSGSCTFVTHPAMTGGSFTPNLAVGYFDGGLYDDNSLVINDSLTFANEVAGFTSGVAKAITPIASAAVGGGGFIVVTGYSLTGNYKALLTYMPGSITIVSEVNNTGGTVAYTSVGNILYITSTGTSTQKFDFIQVKGIIN